MYKSLLLKDDVRIRLKKKESSKKNTKSSAQKRKDVDAGEIMAGSDVLLQSQMNGQAINTPGSAQRVRSALTCPFIVF